MLRHYPSIAAGFAMVLGVLSLVGWLGDVSPLAGPIPGLPPMVLHTAIMTTLAGYSLWSWARHRDRIARVCASALSVLAVLAFVEHIAQSAVSASREPGAAWLGQGSPAPALETAAAFLLLGIALLMMQRRLGERRYFADYMALAVSTLAAGALLGYVFGAPELYVQSGDVMVGMSITSAFAVLALGTGIVASHAENGMASILVARDAGGVAARRLLVGLGLFPFIAFVMLVGVRIGWYALPLASALILLLALVEATVFIFRTAIRLSRAAQIQHATLEALRISEERGRSLVEGASDPIFVADLDGTCIEVNNAACRLLGYRRDELLGTPITDLVPADARTRLVPERNGVRAPTSLGQWELEHKRGWTVPVEATATLLPDGRWQASVRDITERRRAERALAAAAATEHQLRADLEAVQRASAAVSEAIVLSSSGSIDSVLAQIADEARRLTGAGLAAIGIGTDPDRPFDTWVTVGIDDDVARAIGRAPRPIGALGYVVHRGGPLRVADITMHSSYRGTPEHHPPVTSFLAMPIRHRNCTVGNLYLANKQTATEFTDHDERLVGQLADGIAVAITIATIYAAESRKRAWLQCIIDQLPEGVIVATPDGSIDAINRTMAGWASELADGDQRTHRQFDMRDSTGRPLPLDERPLARVLETREPVTEDLALQPASGDLVPVATRAVPLREGDRVIGAVLVANDISERKELERLREEWIAVVAHDLRHPIHTIVLAIDLLTERKLAPDAAHLLGRVRESASRLNRMIEDLLDAARISAERLTVEPRTVDMVELVTQSSSSCA